MLDTYKNVFILNIKGVGMANIAIILKNMGKDVIGADVAEEFITDKILDKNGIKVITGFDPTDLPKTIDLATFSGANNGSNNPMILELLKRGVKVVPQSQLLGELMTQYETAISICGCHGKTTTTSLMAHALYRLTKNVSYFIGSTVEGTEFETSSSKNINIVVESDEYGIDPPKDKTPKLFFLNPTHVICTNIDFDHPDIYETIRETKNAYVKFLSKTRIKKSFLCIDNAHVADIVCRLKKNSYETYGFLETADMHIVNPIITELHSTFQLIYKGENMGSFEIDLSGKHNMLNAAGVIQCLLALNFKVDAIRQAIKGFSGVKRRFELVAYENDMYLFDDYGHHPTEIKATIQAAQARFKNRRLIVIFHPHTFSRTENLKNEFVEALALADLAFIAPIYASARESSTTFTITSERLVQIAKIHNIQHIYSYKEKAELLNMLKDCLRKGDVILTVGAGDIYKLKDDIISVIKQIK